MILITATLAMGIKAAVIVFAQGNNSTNGTSSSQSDNQTNGVVNNNPHSNLPPEFASDKFHDKYNPTLDSPFVRCYVRYC